MGLIGLFMPVGMKILEWYFNRKAASAEAKKIFLQLQAQMQNDGLIAKKNKDTLKRLEAELDQEIKDSKNPKPKP